MAGECCRFRDELSHNLSPQTSSPGCIVSSYCAVLMVHVGRDRARSFMFCLEQTWTIELMQSTRGPLELSSADAQEAAARFGLHVCDVGPGPQEFLRTRRCAIIPPNLHYASASLRGIALQLGNRKPALQVCASRRAFAEIFEDVTSNTSREPTHIQAK